MLRGVALSVSLLAALPAVAGEMNYDEARRFVAGKLFNYTCFEGTRGQGRVFADGSVVGSIQFQGGGPMRYAHLPAGTLKSNNGAVCASLRGLPLEPCFKVEKTSESSFRGSISGLSFMSCEFTRHNGRVAVTHSAHVNQPLGLRPSLTAESR